MLLLIWILTIAFLFILIMYCLQKGKEKRIGLFGVVLIMIFCTPFFGFFVVEALANHKKPCKWCGNNDNESQYCGVCKLDEVGNRKT